MVRGEGFVSSQFISIILKINVKCSKKHRQSLQKHPTLCVSCNLKASHVQHTQHGDQIISSHDIALSPQQHLLSITRKREYNLAGWEYTQTLYEVIFNSIRCKYVWLSDAMLTIIGSLKLMMRFFKARKRSCNKMRLKVN